MPSFTNIEHIVENLCNTDKGFFVDIGAHDGITGNNTKYFEDKGWSGICIEPIPSVFEQLKINRTCQVDDCAIWKSTGTTDFLALTGYTEMLSGIMSDYDPRHFQRVQRELHQHGGTKTLIKVKTKKFSDILQEGTTIDFLSIDTEGSEMSILNNIDFSKYNIKVVCIENNFMDPEFEKFFESRGFYLHSTHMACDQIYTRKES